MTITKQEYILRSLTKIAHKKWEAFIISRIIHGLDDDEIEFVTQQLVRRSDGSRALTDLYFPQFNLHLEIDEPAHLNHILEDAKREQDIIQTTGHRIDRIHIANSDGQEKKLSLIRSEVDAFVDFVSGLKIQACQENQFSPWDWDTRFSSAPVIQRGVVAIRDNVVFHTQIEAMRCFGFQGKGWQRGAWEIPDGSGDVIWFPRLYPHGMWHNELENGGKTIYERAVNGVGELSIRQQIEDCKRHLNRKFIVFAKARDALGFNLLRYVGSFKVNLDKSIPTCLVFDRVCTEEPVRLVG